MWIIAIVEDALNQVLSIVPHDLLVLLVSMLMVDVTSEVYAFTRGLSLVRWPIFPRMFFLLSEPDRESRESYMGRDLEFAPPIFPGFGVLRARSLLEISRASWGARS